MTEKAITPQQVHEFIENLLDDVRAGRITPEGALIASQQYEYLRTVLVENNDAVAGAFSDESKFKSAIIETLEDALNRVKKELPQFQNETPSQPLSPETIVARAKTFRVAREDSSAAISHQQTRVEALKNDFINRLVNNWIEQTKTTTDKERKQSLAREAHERFEKAPLDTMRPPEINRFIQKTLTNTHLDNESIVAQKEFVRETKKLAGLREIPRVLVSRADISHPDWFTSIAIQMGSVSRADTLARQAETLVSPAAQNKDAPDITIFFRAFASTPTQKGFATMADVLLQQLSPLGRQRVIKETFSRTIDGLLAKTDLLTERLGQDFVNSELFRLVVNEARQSFTREAGRPSGAGQIRGVFEDVVGSFLHGPIPPRLIGTPRELILSYFELLRVEAGLPTDRKILFPEHSPTVNSLFAALTPQPEFLGSHTKIPVTETQKIVGSVAALTAQFPSWQMLYMSLLSEFSLTQAPSPVSQSQASTGAPPLATPLGVFGGVFSSLGQILSGATVGISGGLLAMLFGGGLGALFGKNRRPDRPTPLLEDTPKLLAIIIVVSLVVLFVFPSFLNATFINNAAKNGALLVSSVPYAGGPYTDPLPSYGGPFPGGPTAITSCAVDYKHLTQTPFDPGGIGTHIKTCAYDFDAPPYTTQVKATHDGCVAAVTTSIKNDLRIKGSYGNYVLLAGTGLDGKPFYSLYAHLAQNTSSHLSVGSCVAAGAALGNVDSTGNSTGPHLHLEFLNENQGKITEDQCYSTFALPTGCAQ